VSHDYVLGLRKRFVPETEALGALIEPANITATQVTLWLSSTFAYLTASHFVGKALSRFQCLIVSALYIFVSVIYGAAIIMHANAWVVLRESQKTILDKVWITQNVTGWEAGISIFLIGGTIGSLIFMYTVRRKIGE